MGFAYRVLVGVVLFWGMSGSAFAFGPHPFRSWTTVDQPDAGRVSGMVSFGHSVFAAGLLYSNSASAWVVRRSEDGAKTWTTVDHVSGITSNSYANAVASAPDGSIYVVGQFDFAPGHPRWAVRKSTDGGSTWFTVDELASGSSATDVSVAGNGAIYVVGNSVEGWLVRRSSDGGQSWQTVDVFAGLASTVVTNETGAAFVGGSSGGQWTIRYSADGLSWNTVDTFPTLTANKAARWKDRVVFAGGQRDWIVREASFSNPSSWATIDDLSSGAGSYSEADGVTISRTGVVYVSGHIQDASGHYWITRVATLGTSPVFANSDVLLYPQGSCPGFLAGPEHTGSTVDFLGEPVVGRYFADSKNPSVCDWTVRAQRFDPTNFQLTSPEFPSTPSPRSSRPENE